jgi:APA family basic amino acid/polyamine antiporter
MNFNALIIILIRHIKTGFVARYCNYLNLADVFSTLMRNYLEIYMAKKNGLIAKLSLFDATLLVIGSVIGSGIFLTTGIIAESLPDPILILLVWLLGAVLTLFGGLTLAELGAMIPEVGGQYAYLRTAYGPLAGFMYGWLSFFIIYSGGIAALGVGFAEYMSYFLPSFGLQNVLLEFSFISVSAGQLVAVTAILALTFINFFGVRSGSMVQNVFTIIKILAIAVLIVAGIVAIAANSASQELVTTSTKMPTNMITAFGIALIAVLWTFDGWYNINPIATEIKNTERNLPLSLIIGIIVIGIIYFLVNLFYVQALSIGEMAGVVRIGEKAVTSMFGSVFSTIMTALILISIFGCLSATILPGPRIYYAMAKDGLFFKSFLRVHPKYHSPSVAVIWQGIIASFLCLSGTYEQLYTYVIFSTLLFYIALALALFVLRKKMPDKPRPYKVWGYPVVPILFGLAMMIIAINTLIEKPLESLVGLVLLFIGWPVFMYWRKKS